MQQVGDPASLADDNLTTRALLTILLDHYPALISFDELTSELAGVSRSRQRAEMMVADGLAALMSGGLVHKLDGFVFASRAAVRAEQLHR